MTAIAGIIRLDQQPVDSALIELLQGVLAPYGPDDQHHWQYRGVCLLRTLLRSTPEDILDRQPVMGDSGGCVVVFDGRVDNRHELAQELGLSALDSACLSDSQLVCQACERWDERALEHIQGTYALACWQPVRGRLWLARDPIGLRPLFWHRQSGFFAFASLPKALFCIPGVPRVLCEERMLEHLALLPKKGPASSFKDIYRVEPGQCVVLDGDRVSSQRFHRFDAQRELNLPSDDDYLECFKEHLERAVSSCLRSSGPVASQLSSGFDSSTVTALAARQLAARNLGLTAFTAVPRSGFDGPFPKGRHGDESAGARALAERFANIQHVLVRSQGASILEGICADIYDMDTAPQNPCNMVWVNAIYAEAKAMGCKVLLTGQLGNRSISYTGDTHLAGLLRKGKLLEWWRELGAYQRNHLQRGKFALIAKSIAPSLPARLWTLLSGTLDRGQPLSSYSAIHPQWLKRVDAAGGTRAMGRNLGYQPWHDGRRMRIAALECRDPGEHSLGANLRGIEVRDPTSDLRLLEFCLAVPDRQYLRNGQTRWLLRRMMAGVLPPQILASTGKGYQSADWYEAVAADLPRLRDELHDMTRQPSVAQLVDLEGLQALLDCWPQNGWETHEVICNYRLKLMRGISAGCFIRYAQHN